jgi:uncharacterized Zn finger protein
MPRENVFDKSRRLLVSGAVRVVRCDRSGVVALVVGDSEGIHRVTFDLRRWACDCSSVGRCSHGLAVAAVTAPPGPWLLADDVLALIGGAA